MSTTSINILTARYLTTPQGEAVISDFHMSKITIDLFKDRSASQTVTRDTSPRWMAPELMRGGAPSFATDVWSFGMVILEVATGEDPFRELRNAIQVPGALMSNRTPVRPQMNVWVTDPVWHLMKEQCWQMDPRLRPDMSQVHEHLLEASAMHKVHHPTISVII